LSLDQEALITNSGTGILITERSRFQAISYADAEG